MNKRLIVYAFSLMLPTAALVAKGSSHPTQNKAHTPHAAKAGGASAQAKFNAANAANNPAGLVNPLNANPALASQLTPAMAAAVLAQPAPLTAQATAALQAVAGPAAATAVATPAMATGAISLAAPAAAPAGPSFTAPTAAAAVPASMIGAPVQVAAPTTNAILLSAPVNTPPAQGALANDQLQIGQ